MVVLSTTDGSKLASEYCLLNEKCPCVDLPIYVGMRILGMQFSNIFLSHQVFLLSSMHLFITVCATTVPFS